MDLLAGKTGVVFGVANKRSIAWAITRAVTDAGARVALTYQGERLEKNVRELAATLKDPLILPCDVTKDEDIDAVYDEIGRQFDKLDFVIHSVAFANSSDLEGKFVDTPREGFRLALDISAYSLVAVTRGAVRLLKDGGSVVTMTYLGSERAVPGYNVMGVAKAALESSVRYLAADLGEQQIRVNAISAGPVNTLAARGISGFMKMYAEFRDAAPMKRNVDVMEVAGTALFLCSDHARGITGEIIHVDCGYHIMGF
ncbi:MAG: enoyl-ACP reductase [Chloroflexi bacterium]|nr:enoyl-ACP reductase [Chloroflexota bacterium]